MNTETTMKSEGVKHTPGNLTAWAIESPNQHPVAWVAQTVTDNRIDDANAKLIAAAPDLLEACKTALTMMLCVMDDKDSFGNVQCSPKWLQTRDQVRQAITKAT